MPKRNDGNEQDLRVRPANDAHSLDADNPMTGARPVGADPCDEHGDQTDIPPALETPDGPHNYNWADLSAVCPNGFSNRTLDKFFMAVLKNHFSDPDNIFRDTLKKYIYTDDPGTSKIRIVMNTTFDAAQGGQLPAIVVKRGAQKPLRITIGDRATTTTILQGDNRFVRMKQGFHRMLCMASTDGFTEELGQEVDDLFTCLSPSFRTDLPFHDFQPDVLSELGILEDVGSKLGVVATAKYAYEYAWTMRRTAPNLRGVSLDMDVGLATE